MRGGVPPGTPPPGHMRNPDRRIVFASVVIAALALVSFAQTEVRYPELPNFHQVNPQLYRGAQPKVGGVRKLAARAAGLRYFNVPMPGTSKPTDEQINRALTIIKAPENQPVFVHCQRGADR